MYVLCESSECGTQQQDNNADNKAKKIEQKASFILIYVCVYNNTHLSTQYILNEKEQIKDRQDNGKLWFEQQSVGMQTWVKEETSQRTKTTHEQKQ